MKVVVFSDVHGNLPALEQMLKLERDADKFVFLGDAVNYGPWSNECVQMIANMKNVECIRGNHEQYFLDGHYSGKNEVAQAFFDICYPKFSEKEAIGRYHPRLTISGFTFVHTINEKNIYPDTPLQLDTNYFIGHSHHQFTSTSNGFRLWNTGSVGQNRKFINIISYLRWFPETGEIVSFNRSYDVDKVIKAMDDLGYPEVCLQYYLAKERA